jgi:hypothetical protein
MPEAIKTMFKNAASVLLRCDDDDPEYEVRRKGGETEGQFKRMARYLWRPFKVRQGFRSRTAIASRHAPIDPAAYAVATSYLANTLDALNRMNDDPASDYGDDFNAISNPNSPRF